MDPKTGIISYLNLAYRNHMYFWNINESCQPIKCYKIGPPSPHSYPLHIIVLALNLKPIWECCDASALIPGKSASWVSQLCHVQTLCGPLAVSLLLWFGSSLHDDCRLRGAKRLVMQKRIKIGFIAPFSLSFIVVTSQKWFEQKQLLLRVLGNQRVRIFRFPLWTRIKVTSGECWNG